MNAAVGWLGEAYLWVKAAHLILVIFWMAGMFMLPRFFVYHMAAAPGSAEDALWIDREARLMRIIINPSMALVWLLGLALAANYGVAGWLIAKIAIVFAFSGYHGWLSGLRRKFARGERPVSEKALRLANELPSLVTIAVVILVIVKPF
jgi:putative membrane protein